MGIFDKLVGAATKTAAASSGPNVRSKSWNDSTSDTNNDTASKQSKAVRKPSAAGKQKSSSAKVERVQSEPRVQSPSDPAEVASRTVATTAKERISPVSPATSFTLPTRSFDDLMKDIVRGNPLSEILISKPSSARVDNDALIDAPDHKTTNDLRGLVGKDVAQLYRLQHDMDVRDRSGGASANSRFKVSRLGTEEAGQPGVIVRKSRFRSSIASSYKRLNLKSKKSFRGRKWEKNRINRFSRIGSKRAAPDADDAEEKIWDDDVAAEVTGADLDLGNVSGSRSSDEEELPEAQGKDNGTVDDVYAFDDSEGLAHEEAVAEPSVRKAKKRKTEHRISDRVIASHILQKIGDFRRLWKIEDAEDRTARLAEWVDQHLLEVCQSLFDIAGFRDGQFESLRRSLLGDSLLSVLPTGQGKSLLFHTCSVLIPAVTVVITPLIALMTDQEEKLPWFLHGLFFFGDMQRAQRLSLLRKVEQSASAHSFSSSSLATLVFVSPERFVGSEFSSLLQRLLSSGSRLLLCIDEAHCVSEWSHNFRPAYLRIGAVLAGFEETLPGCADRIQTLCLTATASVQTQDSICKHLGCNPEFTVRTSHSLPQGIEFRVVQCENRKKDLLQLLTKSRFWQEDEQVLIYVNFQADADQFAALLRSEGLEADAYHAGRTPTQRSRVQRLFMSGAMKYVVATVAFGMGIHKSDLRVVVHCGLPRSIEGFVQESGRAGRSQRGGVSVVLLDKNDFPRLQSLCFSKSIDKAVVSRVVSDTARTRGVDNELIADLAEISRKNSVQTSLVETIVSYAHSLCPQLIRAVSYETTVYEVVFRNKSAATLGETWKVASFMRDVKSGRGGRYRLVMAEICKSAGLSHEEACVELEEMNSAAEIYLRPLSQGFIISMTKTNASALSTICDAVYEKISLTEETSTMRLQACHALLSKFAIDDILQVAQTNPEQQENFRREMDKYFSSATSLKELSAVSQSGSGTANSGLLKSDIKALLHQLPRDGLHAVNVAKILHGIPSPAFSRPYGALTTFWGSHAKADFNIIRSLAEKEIRLMDAEAASVALIDDPSDDSKSHGSSSAEE